MITMLRALLRGTCGSCNGSGVNGDPEGDATACNGCNGTGQN